MTARLLGPPELSWRGTPLAVSSRKGWALLCYLAARAAPVPRAELAETFWGHGRGQNVRQALHALRKLPGAEAWLLEAGDGTVAVRACSDLEALDAALAEGRYADAVALDRGPFLEGLALPTAPAFEDWSAVERERLDALRRDATWGRVRELEAAQRWAEALHAARALVDGDPLDESAQRAVMRALLHVEGREAALRQFEACRRALESELGLEPLEETRKLADAIQAGTLAAAEAETPAPIPPEIHASRIAGREAEWARLQAASVAGRTAFVSGAAGMGKTRLAGDFAAQRGAVLAVRALAGDADVPYATLGRGLEAALGFAPQAAEAPWVQGELARVLPGRFDDAERTLRRSEGAGARDRLQRAAFTVLEAARAQASLLVEDLHLADQASAEALLRFVDLHDAEGSAPGGGFCLLTFRAEGASAGLRDAIERAVADGAEHVRLGPLPTAAVQALLTELAPDAASDAATEQLARRLRRYTGGNPMFVQETVKELVRRGRVWDAEASLPLPERIDALLRQRLEALSPTALRVTRAVMVAGTDVAPDVLAEVVSLDLPALSSALEELERAHVLSGEQFVHDLLPEAIRANTPRAVARYLHRSLALALQAAGRAGEPGRIAEHWLATGEADRALPHLLEAAQRAEEVYADEEARVRYFQALWATSDGTAVATRSRALQGLEALAARRGEAELAAAALSELEALARHAQDDLVLFAAHLQRAGERIRHGVPQEARAAASTARAIAERLGRHDLVARAALQMGGASFYAGDLAGAGEGFERAARADDPVMRLRARSNLGTLAGIHGDLATAQDHQEEALTHARTHGTLEQVAGLLNNLGATTERRGAYAEAERDFAEALELNRRIGARRQETLSLLNLSEVRLKRGAFQEALDTLAQAHALARPLGDPQLTGRAHLLQGQALRPLGAAAEAARVLERAVCTLRDAEDERSTAVARFNRAMAQASLVAPGAETAPDASDPWHAALEALGELERLGLADVTPWARAELALLSTDAETVASLARDAEMPHDNPHLALLVALGRHRATHLGAADTEAQTLLTERLDGGAPVAETPTGHLALARSLEAHEPAAARHHVERAEALLAEQTRGLTEARAVGRRRFAAAALAPSG